MPLDAYYNENDPEAAATLRELIKLGSIAPGYVDERSISDVRPNELSQFAQCHFFAGIGGWSYALRLAGWPDDLPVWTGSCPCQPFSTAGKGKGFDDERHLWPDWLHLIAERRPPILFGEQLSTEAALAWLDVVSSDLESQDYAVAASDLCAAGVGAPHPRQRLYFLGVENAGSSRSAARISKAMERQRGIAGLPIDGMRRLSGPDARKSDPLRVAYAYGKRPAWTDPVRTYWTDCDWISCRDGAFRPLEPGTFPLAHGIPYRLGTLRGLGNAIVPQVAQAFIESSVRAILATWKANE